MERSQFSVWFFLRCVVILRKEDWETFLLLLWRHWQNFSKQISRKITHHHFGDIYVLAHIKKTKNRKAAGFHEIPPEVWKLRKFDGILLRFCNTVYKKTREKWTKSCIIPFPKKGDLGITKNYRRITLTAIIFTQPLRSGRIWHKVNF